MMDVADLQARIGELWAADVLDHLAAYIAIPAKSPAFDPAWETTGHIEAAAGHLLDWVRRHLHRLPGATAELLVVQGRTPTLVVEVPGPGPDVVLLYGHYDKQPEMEGWHEGLGPWTPVVRDGKLYGRGGADDGYSIYAALIALIALAEMGETLPRSLILIEGSEESGSTDLPIYIDMLADRIGNPPLIVCLDSGCGNYDQLWVTTSLRGVTGGILAVEVLTEGIHSGAGTGIVPSSFRIARSLLARLEDEATGAILPEALRVAIPRERVAEAKVAGAAMGGTLRAMIPFLPGMRATADAPDALILARSWHAGLEVIGADGLPPSAVGGNVMRPRTALKLSLRLPPTLPAGAATLALQHLLEADPPYGAKVTFTPGPHGDGWNAPAFATWLLEALETASHAMFGQPLAAAGEGGSIPFMGMLGTRFPDAQFLITGVLGPESNAHGPNEFLHIEMAQKVTACVAVALVACATTGGRA